MNATSSRSRCRHPAPRRWRPLHLLFALPACVLATSWSPQVSAQSDPVFTSLGDVAVGPDRPIDPVLADLNGDGLLDLVLAMGTSQGIQKHLWIYLGNGDGTFARQADVLVMNGEMPIYATAAYLDGDNHLDLVTTNWANGSGAQADPDVSIFLGAGDGTFSTSAPYNYKTGANPRTVEAGDMNEDGILDIVAAQSGSSSVSVQLGNGDGTFGPAASYPTGSFLNHAGLGDVNGDGHLDVVTAERGPNTVSVFLGNGDGTLLPRVPFTTNLQHPVRVDLDDFDDDGDLDVIVAGTKESTPFVDVLLGNGPLYNPPGVPLLQPPVSYSAAPGHEDVTLADIDGDGHEDIVTGNTANAPPYSNSNLGPAFSILRGVGDGTFHPAVHYSVGRAGGLDVGDVNGDGLLDVVIADTLSNTFEVFLQGSVNSAPLADAGDNQTVNEGVVVTLDGSRSSDPDGDPLVSYVWTQLAGTTVTLDETDPVHPTFTAPMVPRGGETLTFSLVVCDGDLQSDPASTNVTVSNVNNMPVADAGDFQAVLEGSSPVALDGTGSFDDDDDPLTYLWTQEAGPAVLLSDPTSVTPEFTAPFVGSGGETLSFRLVVDDGIDTGEATVDVLVENENHPPVADAGEPQTVAAESFVQLAGSGDDPDMDALSFCWIQLDGPYVTLSNPYVADPSFTAPAVVGASVELVFELEVCDYLACDQATVTITVMGTNAPPDCSLARASLARLWPPNHKLVPIAVTGITDPDNDAVAVTITGVTSDEPVDGLGSGDTSPDAVLQGDTVLIRAERAGGGNGRVYEIAFTADDGQGGTCTGTITVCVPKSKRSATCPDDGQWFDATLP